MVVPSARLIVKGNGLSLTFRLGTTSGTKRGPANAPAILVITTTAANGHSLARRRASAIPMYTNTNVTIGKRMKGLFRPEKNSSAMTSNGMVVKTGVTQGGRASRQPRQKPTAIAARARSGKQK